MQVYDSSLLGDEDPTVRADAFKQTLDALVGPMVDMRLKMADLMNVDKVCVVSFLRYKPK